MCLVEGGVGCIKGRQKRMSPVNADAAVSLSAPPLQACQSCRESWIQLPRKTGR